MESEWTLNVARLGLAYTGATLASPIPGDPPGVLTNAIDPGDNAVVWYFTALLPDSPYIESSYDRAGRPPHFPYGYVVDPP